MNTDGRTLLNAIRTACLLLFLATLLGGCSHRVLTFFFTGVPDPASVRESEIQDQLTEDANEKNKLAKTFSIPQQNYYTHGPWVNRQCVLCHKAPSGQQFNTGPARVSGQLLYPLKELCHNCHASGSFNEDPAKFYQHGPVSNGDCISCHNPHRSSRAYFLLHESNAQLCTSCHDKNLIHRDASYVIDSALDCIGCHNPHGSQRPMLLRADVLK